MHKQDIGEEGQETWLRSGINIALIVHCVDMTKTRCTAALCNTVKMNVIRTNTDVSKLVFYAIVQDTQR